MGAGQIGGIATLLDIDFNNAAGFQGVPAKVTEAQYIVHYLSHTMLFCVGALIEAHIVLTPAICVFGERYKFKIFAGTHQFLENAGAGRQVQHLCIHKVFHNALNWNTIYWCLKTLSHSTSPPAIGLNYYISAVCSITAVSAVFESYNHTLRWEDCSADNLALLCLNEQFSFNSREPYTDYILNRVRYGFVSEMDNRHKDTTCQFYGWGSRRNGYLIPLLIYLFRVDVSILPASECAPIFNYDDKYLCIQQPKCKTEIHGALCPDDLGTVLVCSGYVQGMMISRLIDRPCGVGFVDLTKYNRFLTCGVDDSRDVIDHDEFMAFDFSTHKTITPALLTAASTNVTEELT